jgi:uncharacterized membrane protein YoaK (UPF0700 family)
LVKAVVFPIFIILMPNFPKNNFTISLSLHVELLLLSAIAASIDAIGYLKLGHVLTANMTGNTVLLGISLGRLQVAQAVRGFVALAGFVTGVCIGASLAHHRRKGWEETLAYSLGIEFILVLLMGLFWLAFMIRFHYLVVIISIVLCSIAMGLQSATVKHLDIPGVVTTYITGTITAVVSEVVVNFRKLRRSVPVGSENKMPAQLEKRIGLQAGIFLVYLASAALTVLIYRQGLEFLPLVPLVLILSVILLVTHRLSRKRAGGWPI